jgi:hypothetical protein
MNRTNPPTFWALLLGVIALYAASDAQPVAAQSKSPAWGMNATIIEACSCPMFCQCYFNSKPAAHGMAASHGEGGEHAHGGGEHFCRFNNAFQVNKGTYAGTKLDGAKFWVSGDLGGDFSQGKMDWAVLTFDPSVTKPQREGIQAILGHVYPVTWNSFAVAPDAAMEWGHTKDRAVAKLDGGKTAEVVLNRFPGMSDEPIVISNLRYFGVPRNTGFVMMPNEVEAYRTGDKAFEFKGTNGFMITIDINSKDVEKAGDKGKS